MKICMVTAYDEGWSDLGELTHRNKLGYVERHGYSLVCTLSDSTKFRDGRVPHPAWWKVAGLRSLMAHNAYDWYFWTDADAIIMDAGRRLEEFIQMAKPANSLVSPQFIISADPLSINTGAFFIRNTPSMRAFMDEVWDWGERHPVEREMSPWEQRAFHELKGDGRIPGIRVVPQQWFNAYDPALYDPETNGCYQDGDFMLHYPGHDLPWKLREIRKRLGVGQ